MDYQDPNEPKYQQDNSGQPPSEPQEYGQQPTQPPPHQPYQVPEEQNYDDSMYGGQPAPPPPPQRKGFNWLACCGITCVILLIVGGLVAWCSYRMVQPFVGMGIQMGLLTENVQSTGADTIKAGSIAVDSLTLSENPADYDDKWVEVTGEIVIESSDIMSGFTSGGFSTEDSTNYLLDGNIFVMDISKNPAVGIPGDTIRAWGKIYAWDLKEMEKMPFIGQIMSEAFDADPELQGNTKMIFFIAKEVERVEDAAPEPVGEAEPMGEPLEETEGWGH